MHHPFAEMQLASVGRLNRSPAPGWISILDPFKFSNLAAPNAQKLYLLMVHRLSVCLFLRAATLITAPPADLAQFHKNFDNFSQSCQSMLDRCSDSVRSVTNKLKGSIFDDGLAKPEVIDCPICLTEMTVDQSLRQPRSCNHFFHTECLSTWEKTSPACPVCRAGAKALPSPSARRQARQQVRIEPETEESRLNRMRITFELRIRILIVYSQRLGLDTETGPVAEAISSLTRQLEALAINPGEVSERTPEVATSPNSQNSEPPARIGQVTSPQDEQVSRRTPEGPISPDSHTSEPPERVGEVTSQEEGRGINVGNVP
ncbi:hypothetical protein PSTG_12817 [Puccinia striiformis f. sp. tritici PST-78]|uniref:RING-type domain-containing protein n=1 Tax=Puccinia striiformis f. sp. tritici PST-78 TaxID=1165861 RepID=A0A0L0V3D5_9BASI|nr:hypothetical protein PSTG_12817 [Puccinia striiformis f. sp. tritici PST-78]